VIVADSVLALTPRLIDKPSWLPVIPLILLLVLNTAILAYFVRRALTARRQDRGSIENLWTSAPAVLLLLYSMIQLGAWGIEETSARAARQSGQGEGAVPVDGSPIDERAPDAASPELSPKSGPASD
jgi:hypothetical protein